MNTAAVSRRIFGSTELFVKRNGPAILTGAGVAGFVATTVLVGRAVLKSQTVVGGLKKDSNKVSSKEITEDYTEKDKAKEMGQLWIRQSLVLAKIYSPAITVGTLSIACICASHGMMRKNQAALVAAYGALDQGFKAYRKRVEEELGPEKELEFYRGERKILVVPDDGTEGCIITKYDDVIASPYARFFDESNRNWTKTPEYNLMFLRSQQNWANDRLRIHGFVFLNEVYEALGLERSQAGQAVGWKLDGTGDGFIDFGIYDISDESARAFINGLERTVLLDFNVDGLIRI